MNGRDVVRVRVPGKVNLALITGGRRPDGYHDLATVFHAVSLVDDVIATAMPSGHGIALEVQGEGADVVPVDAGNLAWRAAERVAEALGVDPDVRLHLSKGIPVAGGMAGGSADAAGALLACHALWGGGLDRSELDAMAAELGADVPFALQGGTALGLGRGDVLTSMLAPATFHWVFALADGGLSTPAVFARLDGLRADRVLPEPRVPDDLVAALRAGDAVRLGAALVNDLQPAALSLRPDLARTLEAGTAAGALGGVVSGSGPTCAFLARSAEHALDLAVTLAADGVCRTVRTASGPVPGARVVTA
jgi:4-diphosphocytidyl-2-C-methyl-D-erythritol kinase